MSVFANNAILDIQLLPTEAAKLPLAIPPILDAPNGKIKSVINVQSDTSSMLIKFVLQSATTAEIGMKRENAQPVMVDMHFPMFLVWLVKINNL